MSDKPTTSEGLTDDLPQDGQPQGDPSPKDRGEASAPIPFLEKCAYGSGQIGNGISNLPKYIATPLFVMQLGISPLTLSLCMSLFTLWDAISDPIMGAISDNFRSRWGRRRPFIVLGAVLSTIILPLLFLFDRSWGHTGIMTWFVIVGIVFYTADTIFNMPYQSLLLEMTADYNERTTISAYRGVLGKVTGLIFSWLWAFTQLDIFKDSVTGTADTLAGTRWAAVIGAAAILVFSTLPGLFCKERYYKVASVQKKEGLFSGMKKTFHCRPFLILIGLTILFMVSGSTTNGFGMYILNYYVFKGDQAAASVMTGYSGTLAGFVGIAIVPLVVMAAKKMSKEKVLLYVLVSNALLCISVWFCYNPDYPWLVVIPSVLGMPIMSAIWVVLPAMQADVVDHDEVESHERREGNFAAVFSWSVKAAATLSGVIAGPLLVFSGFDVDLGVNQTEEALFMMRVMMVSIPFFGMIGCLFLLRFYAITPEKALETRLLLEERRGRI